MRRQKDVITVFFCLIIVSLFLTLLSNYQHASAFTKVAQYKGILSSFLRSKDRVYAQRSSPDNFHVIYNFKTSKISLRPKRDKTFKLSSNGSGENAKTFTSVRTLQNELVLSQLITGNVSLCDGVDILVYVQSSIKNFMARRNIRRTWASKTIFNHLRIQTLFILGRPSSVDEQIRINNEQILHGDILEGTFTEHHKNLSFKSVLAMHFISCYCSNVKYVIKTDDDIFLNTLKVVENILPKLGPRTVACHVIKEGTSPIVRDSNSRWFIPSHIFLNESLLPRFCTGYAVLMTSALVSELYSQVDTSPFFQVDDVYMFGQLTQSLGNVTFLDIKESFQLNQDKGLDSYRQGNQDYVAVNIKGTAAMEELWAIALTDMSKWAKDHNKVNSFTET